jgi:hypothetical protein
MNEKRAGIPVVSVPKSGELKNRTLFDIGDIG